MYSEPKLDPCREDIGMGADADEWCISPGLPDGDVLPAQVLIRMLPEAISAAHQDSGLSWAMARAGTGVVSRAGTRGLLESP
jgi:hypothetical protein